MLETDEKQNWRLAFEELNRLLRYIDNFFWILSSFWMVGTGFALSKAFEWNGENWQILIIGIIMIVAWTLFLFFMKNVSKQSRKYLDSVNYFEDKLGIDVLPKKEIEGGVQFRTIMIIVACSSIVIWCGFIIQFIDKNWCNLCHCF